APAAAGAAAVVGGRGRRDGRGRDGRRRGRGRRRRRHGPGIDDGRLGRRRLDRRRDVGGGVRRRSALLGRDVDRRRHGHAGVGGGRLSDLRGRRRVVAAADGGVRGGDRAGGHDERHGEHRGGGAPARQAAAALGRHRRGAALQAPRLVGGELRAAGRAGALGGRRGRAVGRRRRVL